MDDNEISNTPDPNDPNALVGKKLFITVEMDQWLDETWGPTRQRSAAVQAALERFREEVESNKAAIAKRQIFTLEDALKAL
jgi:hypothetical protein